MKIRIGIGVLVWMVTSAMGQNMAWVTNYITDGNGNPVSVNVKATLLSEIYSSTNRLVIRAPMTWAVGTNGVLYTNLMAGLYTIKFGDYYGQMNVLVPNTTNLYDLGDLKTNSPTFNVTNYVVSVAGSLVVGDVPSASIAGFGLASTNWVLTNSAAVTSALGFTPATNHWAETLGVVTNNGVMWCATNLPTGTDPNAVLPNGSILTATNGAFYVRSNGTWLLK